MKTSKSNKKSLDQIPTVGILNEPDVLYATKAKSNDIHYMEDFTYDHFKEIANKGPFNQNDWAGLLHISDRTLQRYAKENASFNGLQIERILHLEHLIDAGTDLFGKEGFKNWLVEKPFSLNGNSPKDFLSTYLGIQKLIDLIGRMQHGIPA